MTTLLVTIYRVERKFISFSLFYKFSKFSKFSFHTCKFCKLLPRKYKIDMTLSESGWSEKKTEKRRMSDSNCLYSFYKDHGYSNCKGKKDQAPLKIKYI